MPPFLDTISIFKFVLIGHKMYEIEWTDYVIKKFVIKLLIVTVGRWGDNVFRLFIYYQSELFQNV